MVGVVGVLSESKEVEGGRYGELRRWAKPKTEWVWLDCKRERAEKKRGGWSYIPLSNSWNQRRHGHGPGHQGNYTSERWQARRSRASYTLFLLLMLYNVHRRRK